MTTSDSDSRTKVERIIETYELTELGDRLERRWTAEGEERESLRTLADHVNREILRAVFEEHGRHATDEAVEHAHQILTGDDVSMAARTQLQRELARDGIDVEALQGDFVSHQAVHTYLRSVRGATRPSAETDPAESAEQTINRLQSRIGAVVLSNVERLANAGDFHVGDPDALVTVEVLCTECGASKSIGRLLEDGGCECRND